MEKRVDASELTGLSREDIVAKFDELLKAKEIHELIPLIDELQAAYHERSEERREAEKQKFLDEGGYPTDFVFQKDKTDSKFTELYNIFKDRKEKFIEEKRARERDNLSAKRQVIDDLKALIEKGDSVGKAFQHFRQLRDRWNGIGDVPKKEEEKLESDYRYQRERFYHIIQITQGLKELDLQKHLQAKNELLKKMEDLLAEKNIRKMEALIRQYRNDWYDIGPVPGTQKDEIIRRFNETSEKVYSKIREHYEALKRRYEENLKAKNALCEKAEAIALEELQHHRGWDKKTKELRSLQDEWKKIGRVPQEHAEAVWERFRKACNEFFDRKRAFYETLKKDYEANKLAKTQLCEQAEAVQNSTDWDKTAKFLIGLQRQWENTGPAGLQKAENELWQRFRAACNTFFEARKKHFEALDEARKNNLGRRNEIIARLEELAPSVSSADALPVLQAIGKEWDEAGEIPANLREDLYKRYRRALDACYDRMGLNEKDKEMLKYASKIEQMKNSNDAIRLLEDERRFLRGKIRSMEDEIAKTENNMGFFAKSDKAAALLQDVLRNVELSKEQLAFFKKKLEMVEKNLPRKEQIR
ncbi:MAG TPA: DUF349 domain-containing protein [Chitinophagales bacterium]|nr:DUF349 domain-containing protein [Chitinophagales bacterium]